MASSSRARFQADLASAVEKDIPNIYGIHKRDDGLVFTFHHPNLQPPHHVNIHVTPQDETFLVYTDDGNIPAGVADVLGDSMEKSHGLKVPAMLEDLSRRLRAALEGTSVEDEDTAMTDIEDSEFDADNDSDDIGDDSYGDGGFEYGDNDLFGIPGDRVASLPRISKPIPPSILRHIRRDLRATREAGFKVGVISGFNQYADQSIVSISVRVDKLCLSDETRHAWNLDSSDFIVLLIRFNDGCYTTFQSALDVSAGQSNLEFRLRKCSRYKPTLPQAMLAFSSQNPMKGPDSSSLDDEDTSYGGLSLLSIGTSVDMFMDKDFIPMLKLRKSYGISWDAAKKHLSVLEKEAVPPSSLDILPQPRVDDADKADKESNDISDKVPRFLADNDDDSSMPSLPLIATKFAMRYLVRCADYCMICHQRVEGNFEGLKPYVCGDTLCLFQYMALGFGPSIDTEIIDQPRVVDLLVSFCFAGLIYNGLREFPTGLSLPVPNIRIKYVSSNPYAGRQGDATTSIAKGTVLIDPIEVNFDWDTSTAIVESTMATEKLRVGQWVVVTTPITTAGGSAAATYTVPKKDGVEVHNCILHYANIQMVFGRAITLRVAARHPLPISQRMDEECMRSLHRSSTSHIVLFNQNLDDLPHEQRAFSMLLLLGALPSIPDMKQYLLANPGRQLSTWADMVPASMVLLRWIVASNRSYIVQIDEPTEGGNVVDKQNATREHERIPGVSGWMQFRFAQGSPEKEALFQVALEAVQKPQRTLLAWHGSNLSNWHSIIRQGLDYSVVSHGRAYGNGVYFSRDFQYSMGYTKVPYNSPSIWPKSILKIDGAMGLAELVNRPEEFQSSSPFFVVQHCHWIQCRYLFVKCLQMSPGTAPIAGPSQTLNQSGRSSQEEFVQDPQFITTGPRGTKLFVPKIAIPSASENKKHLPDPSFKHDAQGHTGDTGDEDDSDINFFDSDDGDKTPTAVSRLGSPEPGVIVNLPPSPVPQEPRTDFHPGTLDLKTLPRLKPPTYATDSAQRSIGRELKKLQQVQSSTPMQELGWYIDFDKVDNMFQWIVELHSFELSLPLGQDMQNAGVESIVLEIRFGREFPMSPPFVRVIRPRFLPFAAGGGGHVTAGGAMCMELLTTTGWSPANSLEAVLVQVRLALCNVDPAPARLYRGHSQHYISQDYGIGEAFDAYARSAMTHGWEVPKDQQEMRSSAYGA